MVSPEISRRCLICGASVRAAARFCPQCGAGLAGESKRDSLTREEMRQIDKAQPAEPFAGERSRMARSMQSQASSVAASSDEGQSRKVSSPITSPEYARAGEQFNRAKDDENEAVDDVDTTGGWRFLIVATALILFFVLVFILHKTIR